MVSMLDSGTSSLHSNPGQGHCVVFLGKTLYSYNLHLSTQVYKRVSAYVMLKVTLRWTSIPSRGYRNTVSQLLHATETGISSGLLLSTWLVCLGCFTLNAHSQLLHTLSPACFLCLVYNSNPILLITGNLNVITVSPLIKVPEQKSKKHKHVVEF